MVYYYISLILLHLSLSLLSSIIIIVAEPFSVERRKLMRMLGAKVIVTPKAGKGTGMVEKAKELSEKHGW